MFELGDRVRVKAGVDYGISGPGSEGVVVLNYVWSAGDGVRVKFNVLRPQYGLVATNLIEEFDIMATDLIRLEPQAARATCTCGADWLNYSKHVSSCEAI